MKKLLFILLLISGSIYAQTDTGEEQVFDYGIRNNAAQTVTSATYVTTTSATGTQGKMLPANLPVSTQTQIAIDGKVSDTIRNGINSIAPSENAVYDALQEIDLQSSYDKGNTIITSTALGAVTIKRGSAADTDNVLVVQNVVGGNTFAVKGNGDIFGGNTTLNSLNATVSATINNLAVSTNGVHSDGTIVVRESTSGGYGTASQQTLQNIIGIGGDFASNPSLLLFQGDSMTAGVPPADPYPDSIVTANVFDKENNAVGSKTIATIRTEAQTLDDVLYRFSARENIYILWAGTNDLYNTHDVATTFKNLEATCRERQKKGFKVIVLTTVPRCGFAADGITTMASLILDYNTLIRQRWSTFADNIADVASNTTLNSVNPCIDTTYYNGDGIHLTNTGNALLLPYIQNSINQLSTQTTFQDVSILGKIVKPLTISDSFGTSTTALNIYNPDRVSGNLGKILFSASSVGVGDNAVAATIEAVSNGASIGQTILNIKVAENAFASSTILSMDGVSKDATFINNVIANSYSGGATLTGAPTAPTATAGTNTTQIATTAFVQANKNKLVGYTVATLPAGTIGDMAYVTDASGFSYNSILVGGGSGVTIAFFDGTNWRAH